MQLDIQEADTDWNDDPGFEDLADAVDKGDTRGNVSARRRIEILLEQRRLEQLLRDFDS